MVSLPFIMCFHVYFSGILGEIALDDWGDAILNGNDVEFFPADLANCSYPVLVQKRQ